jgi:hypothetical protein
MPGAESAGWTAFLAGLDGFAERAPVFVAGRLAAFRGAKAIVAREDFLASGALALAHGSNS